VGLVDFNSKSPDKFFSITKKDIDENNEYLSNGFILPNIGYSEPEKYANLSITYLPYEAFSLTLNDFKVNYNLNSYSFRCDEFKTNHENKKHALFVGCSETFGVAAEEGTVWSNYLYDELNKNNDFSGFFSLGHPGQSTDVFFHNIYVYFKKFGIPDYIFMWFPNLEREVKWIKNKKYASVINHPHLEYEIKSHADKNELEKNLRKDMFFNKSFEEREDFIRSQLFSRTGGMASDHIFNNVPQQLDDRVTMDPRAVTKEEYMRLLFKFKEQLVQFEAFCKSNDIIFKWQINRSIEEKYMLWLDCFENFVPVTTDNSYDKFLEKNVDRIKEQHFFFRRDGGHFGHGVHEYRALKFLESIT
jgi:hypothetical protein